MSDISDRLLNELVDAVKDILRKEQSDRLRDIYLVGDIDKDSARTVIERLRELTNDSRKPITIYMNTAGGNVTDGLAIHDTVRHLVTNQVIEINGDTARAVSYWMNYGNNADRRKIEWLSFGSWDDEFVKIDGQWFFKRHTIYNEGNPNRFTAGQSNPLKR